MRIVTLAGQSLWRDEVDTIRFSSWAFRDLISGLTQQGHNGPLFFLLVRPWRILTGDSEFALRYPSAALGTLAIPVGYTLARRLGFSRRAGLLLGLLLATSPYLVWYSQEAKMYTLLWAVVTLAFVAYLKALAGQGVRWWIVFVVSTSISFYLHILAPLMLAVYGLVAILQLGDVRRRRRAWLIGLACLTLPYLPLAVWQLDFLISGVNRGHPFYPLRQEFYILLQLYASGLLRIGWINLTAIVTFIFLFLAGLFLNNRRAVAEKVTSTTRLLLAAWALLPPLVVYLISLRVPIFEDRYLIYITPAFYLLAVLGLILVRRHSRPLAGLCLGLILTVNAIGIWQQQSQPIKPNFRAAGEYLSNQSIPPAAIMVQMPYLRHTLDYYYPANYSFIEGVWTNGGQPQEDVARHMVALTANLSDVWLVVSEEDTWDNRHLVRGWLGENATLVDQAHFTRVELYHYQLRPGVIETQSTTFE